MSNTYNSIIFANETELLLARAYYRQMKGVVNIQDQDILNKGEDLFEAACDLYGADAVVQDMMAYTTSKNQPCLAALAAAGVRYKTTDGGAMVYASINH